MTERKPPHPLMPVVFGPDHAPPPAPPLAVPERAAPTPEPPAPDATRSVLSSATEGRSLLSARIETLRNAPWHPIVNPFGVNPDEFGGSDYP